MTHRARPLLAILCLVLPGCGSDPQGPDDLIDPPAGYAANADEAVRFLRNALLQIDAGAMARVLHPDFEFELSPDDATVLQLPAGPVWDRATHLAWCTNMFEGKPGIRTDGVLQNPLDPLFGFTGLWVAEDGEEWVEIPDGPFAGTMRRAYGGQWQIQYLAGDFDFVQGLQTFTVTSRHVVFPEGTANVFEVVRWRSENVPPPGKHETISWGRLIAKFRFDEILDPPAGYAATADDVVTRLQQACRDRDLAQLARLLHPTFVFELDPLDAQAFSLDPTWDRATQLTWSATLFSGAPGTRADGSVQPGVDQSSGLSGAWTPVDVEQGWTLVSQGPYLQTLERQFADPWTATFSDASVQTIDGVQTFNVVEGVVEIDGDLARAHQLRRWASAAPEAPDAVSFGSLLAWYRSVSGASR